MFYGLGADGTVSANKSSIKIIGEATELYAQGYFVYDSKKAGAQTVSHLRFGDKPIRSTYLCSDADFLACHNFTFLEKYDMLANLKSGGTFLLNSPFERAEVWDQLPRTVQEQLIDRKKRSSTSSMRTSWRGISDWARESTPSCRQPFSKFPVFCPRIRRSN